MGNPKVLAGMFRNAMDDRGYIGRKLAYQNQNIDNFSDGL